MVSRTKDKSDKWPGGKDSNLSMPSLGYPDQTIHLLQHTTVCTNTTPSHRAKSSGLPTQHSNCTALLLIWYLKYKPG